VAKKLPPLPTGVAPGSGYWNDWYEKLRTIVNNLLTSIAHNSLTGLQGGGGGEYYHLTAAEHTALSTPEWVYVKLTSDQIVSTSTSTATSLAFTPAANTLYEVEGQLWLRSGDLAVGPQPGIAWNSGNSDGVAHIETTNASTTTVLANLTNGTDGKAAATTFPSTSSSYPAQINASFKTGASPTGSFTITLATS
jgi:hypothetical protein